MRYIIFKGVINYRVSLLDLPFAYNEHPQLHDFCKTLLQTSLPNGDLATVSNNY